MEQPKFELDRLLKAKRFEMPDEAFWDAFDARLKASLAEEMQPQCVPARASAKEFLRAWLRRRIPVAAVGLLAFGGVWCFSSLFRVPRPEICWQPSDVHVCRLLSFDVPPSSELAVSVLKKNVALTAGGYFTF